MRMRALWIELKPYFRTITLIYGLLAAVFGSIPVLSIILKILHYWHIEVHLVRLPRDLLAEWLRLKTAFFVQVRDVFRDFGIYIPEWIVDLFSTWLADAIAIYLLLAISVYRGSVINRKLDRRKLATDPESFKNELRIAANLHGHRTSDNLISAVVNGLQPGFLGYVRFQRRIVSSAIRWPIVLKRNFVQLRRGKATSLARGPVAIWLTMLLCALLGAMIYLFSSLIANSA